MTDAAPAPQVVVPAGPALADAAAWVGHACWSELRLHAVLTGWLADEGDDGTSVALWAIRAAAAERAEAWHRRLPELAELPRVDLVVSASEEVDARLAALAQVAGAGARRDALAAELRTLRSGYEARVAVAVGPADGPVAATLQEAMASLRASEAALDR